MNKKGFTLVELLAVIVLLTLLGVFTVSTVLEQTEANKGLVDKATEKIIKSAAQEYVSINNENFERKSGNIYCIEVEKVLNATNVEDINANTKNKLSSTNTYVKVIFSKDNFEYDITSDCVTNVDILPNTPNLRSNMIPIKWDSNNNIVKADPSKSGDWYDYSEKRWANAMIVSHDYLAALKSLKSGELIVPFNQTVEDAIFVVWIPRFKYSISSNIINITFEAGQSSTGATHPAFENNDGFWISKFELTRNTQVSSSYSFSPHTDSKASLETLISNIADVTDYNFVKKEATVSMINNYEWAATAFLTNSKYGIGSEKLYPSDNKTGIIRRYAVGLANLDYKLIPLTKNSNLETDDAYYSKDSVFTSSTRNMTGVYGLSGGANEWIIDAESKLKTVYNTDAAALRSTSGRLGSATSTYDINSGSNYCLARGGNLNTNGLFAFDFYPCNSNFSTRMTIK